MLSNIRGSTSSHGQRFQQKSSANFYNDQDDLALVASAPYSHSNRAGNEEAMTGAVKWTNLSLEVMCKCLAIQYCLTCASLDHLSDTMVGHEL